MPEHTYIFAGGGTGGHLFPGIAVASELRRRRPDAVITFLTTTRDLDATLLSQADFAQITQPVRPFTVHPLRMPGFWINWRRAVRAATDLMKDSRPDAVLGLGGYAAGPAVVAARSLGVRTAILNPDAVPGIANRYLARYADVVVLQWDVSREHFSSRVECRTLGCPIREMFLNADRAAGRRAFGLDPDRPVLLVTGASQGARTVNRVMQRVWPEFVAEHGEWQLLHLSGPLDEEETKEAYRNIGGVVVRAFVHEMWLALAAADAVVSRAGASTLAELTALGLPSVLLPYPYHRDKHQHANANVLVDAGAAMLVDDLIDTERNRGPVLAALRRLADQETRESMAAAARTLARPTAAADVAKWMADEPGAE